MNEERSARLAMPLLQPGQAQKEMDHNEALALLDIAVQPVVAAVGVNVPPDAAADGECWIVGAAPTLAWAGHAGQIAGWTAGGWRFLAPQTGFAAWSVADALPVRYAASGWTIGTVTAARLVVGGQQVVGARLPAIAEPSGGAVIDGEARTTLALMLAALRGHGLISA